MLSGDGEGGPVDKAVLREEFRAMDTSGDGSLDADELTEVFTRLGKTPKKSTINNLVRLADTDGNGTIEWEEFEKVLEIMDHIRDVGHYGKKEEEETREETRPHSLSTPSVTKWLQILRNFSCISLESFCSLLLLLR